MADETIIANADGTILNKGSPILISLKCAADYPKPGNLVAQLSATTAGLVPITSPSTYGVCGLVLEDPSLDLGTAFAVNKPLRIARLGSPCSCWSFMDQATATNVYVGMPAFLGASTSGTWGIAGASFVSAAATNEQDVVAVLLGLVGRVGRYDAQITDGLRVNLLQLSF